MSYQIDSIENDEQPVRNYSGQNGTVYVFKVTTTEGALCEVGKQKGKPQKGDTYKTLRMPSEKAPEGALPTLQDKDFDASPAPVNGSHLGGSQVNSGSKTYGKSPEEQKAIQRQHSQEMAIRMVAELRELGLRPDGLDSATAAIAYVKTLTDHFEKDIAS